MAGVRSNCTPAMRAPRYNKKNMGCKLFIYFSKRFVSSHGLFIVGFCPFKV